MSPERHARPRILNPTVRLGDLPAFLRRHLGGALKTEREFERMEAYLSHLVRWNQKINLTGAKTLEELAQRHVAESLAALPLLPVGPLAAADVGSGAGLPGIPLKIARPDIHLFLVERQHKKAVFLRQAVLEAGLEHAEVVEEPWESWSTSGKAPHLDCVVSRAALDLSLLLDGALRLLRPGGRILLFLGRDKAQALANGRISGTAMLWKGEMLLPGSERRYLVHLEIPA